jgi:protein TonB
MPPIVKENETSTATATAAPSAIRPSLANPAEVAARPQPVALEVPVSVNGARTVEGTEKREPFSENTKTVLVFGNGAVIRLTSSVAPGQLLFLTNDKTKKEVVCQVVKSKNYRNVSGYVELEFTEPVVGFWGMRFPTDRIGSQPAPVAAGPVLVPAAAPKAAAPAAPVAAKPVELKPVQSAPVLPAPGALKLEAEKIASPPPAIIAPPPAFVVPPTLEEFMVSASSQPAAAASGSAPPAEIPVEQAAAKIDTPAVADSLKLDLPAAPAPPTTPSFSELAAALTASLTSPTSSPAALPSIFPPPVAQKHSSPSPSDPSMEELKQETARLQQQLAALLFTELPAPSAAPPAPALDSAAVAATTEKLLEIAQAEPAPPKEFKPAAPARPLPQSSLGAEDVKIPSWLEPLTRNDPAPFAAENAHVNFEAQLSQHTPSFAENPETAEASAETSNESDLEAPSFGSRYSHEDDKREAASSGGSKKGLWIGIAAGIVLAGGAAWYLRSPSSAQPVAVSAAAKPAPAAVKSAMDPIVPITPATTTPATPSPSNAASSVSTPSSAPIMPQVGSSRDAAKPAAKSAMPADTLAALAATPHPLQPEPEQPKKPVMGDVRLAAPNVNRKNSNQDAGESAPELDGQRASSGEGLGTMAISNSRQPAAPLPVGGDVKSAVLLSSTPPVYPSLARTQHVNGDVKIDALIDATGHVTTMKILSGPTLLHQSAMTALKQWRYQPATLNGNPVPMHLTVTLQFRIQ